MSEYYLDGKYKDGVFNGKLSRPSSDGVDYNLTVLRTIEFLTVRGYIAAKR